MASAFGIFGSTRLRHISFRGENYCIAQLSETHEADGLRYSVVYKKARALLAKEKQVSVSTNREHATYMTRDAVEYVWLDSLEVVDPGASSKEIKRQKSALLVQQNIWMHYANMGLALECLTRGRTRILLSTHEGVHVGLLEVAAGIAVIVKIEKFKHWLARRLDIPPAAIHYDHQTTVVLHGNIPFTGGYPHLFTTTAVSNTDLKQARMAFKRKAFKLQAPLCWKSPPEEIVYSNGRWQTAPSLGP